MVIFWLCCSPGPDKNSFENHFVSKITIKYYAKGHKDSNRSVYCPRFNSTRISIKCLLPKTLYIQVRACKVVCSKFSLLLLLYSIKQQDDITVEYTSDKYTVHQFSNFSADPFSALHISHHHFVQIACLTTTAEEISVQFCLQDIIVMHLSFHLMARITQIWKYLCELFR